MAKVNKHKVDYDMAGFSAKRPRYTCVTCEQSGTHATLVRQPYMSESDWDSRVKEFFKQHPAAKRTLTRV